MRVLHCVPSMTGGGAERQLAYLAAGLVAAGDEVHVALEHGGANLERLRGSGASVHALEGLGHHDPRLLFRLRGLVRELRPQVVQTWITQMDVLGGLVALASGLPWVVAEQNSALHYPPTWKNRLRRLVGKRASAVVANSATGSRYWEELGGRARRYVVPNGLPLAEIAEARASDGAALGLQPRERLVLFAGRFVEQKNLPGLLRALPAVAALPDVRVVLCGEGPEREALQALASALGLDGRVALAGYQPDVWGLMKRASAFVSVSRHEGQPNTVQEAMACGCPLVVSDIPEHREILDAASALLVPPGSPERIAEALCAVLADRAAAEARARAASERVAGRSIPAMAAAYRAVYRDVCA
jgi:glycosyltransferase involved in cell wall biosynthesis